MDFQRYVRKYVWNDEKTPYLTKVGRLTRRQARNELFVFSVLIATFFFVVGMAALLGITIVAGSIVVALYSFAVCCAALALVATRHPAAAIVCATVPPAVLLFLLVEGFPPQLHWPDKLVIAGVILALWFYTIRLMRIVRAYPYLEEGQDPAPRPGP